MTKLEALKKAERVVVEGVNHVPTQIDVFVDVGLSPEKAMRAMNGSLSAAEALHEAVLPHHVYNLRNWPGLEAECTLESTYQGEDGQRWQNGTCTRHSAESTSSARAWLLSIIKALIAIEEGKT